MKVDLSAKKTEAQWQTTMDNFILSITPIWFQWLGWAIMVGALAYLADTTKSIPLIIVTSISGVMLQFYFISYFYKFKFINVPFLNTQKYSRLVLLMISCMLGLLFWLLFFSILGAIKSTKA